MEGLTIGQVVSGLAIATPVITALWFLFKIYTKIESSEKLTKANLKATSVMLDHFIENKIGNGEFKQARELIDNALLGKVG